MGEAEVPASRSRDEPSVSDRLLPGLALVDAGECRTHPLQTENSRGKHMAYVNQNDRSTLPCSIFLELPRRGRGIHQSVALEKFKKPPREIFAASRVTQSGIKDTR